LISGFDRQSAGHAREPAITPAHPAPDLLSTTLHSIGQAADARAQEIRALRRLPADIAEQLVASRVFATWVPACHGGLGGSAMDLFDAIEQLAWHHGSVAWCVMVGGTSALTSGFLPPAWASTIYGDPRTVSGGFAGPAGRARPVDGGLRVSGRWSWGSGLAHCNWVVGGVVVSDDGQAGATRSDGLRTPIVFFPRAEVQLHDNWHTLGLQGTGSVDYEVHDVFVPEGRWVAFPMREPVVDAPLYRFSTVGALAAGVAFVAVGLARRAIDELILLATTKVPAGGSRRLAERALVQCQLVEAESAWLSARGALRDAVAGGMDEAARDGGISAATRRRLRVAAINAVERCTRAVDLCFAAGGGSSIHDGCVLQRVFCDMHTASQHGINSTLFSETLGRIAMGVPADTGLL